MQITKERYIEPEPLGTIKRLPWITENFVIRIAGEEEGSFHGTAERLAFLSKNRTGFPNQDVVGWERILREGVSKGMYTEVFKS